MIFVILAVVIFFLLIALSMIWPPDSPWAPWWRTSRRIARSMCRLSDVGEKDTVYDLGSGDGSALLVATEEFGAKGVGIEIDPSRVFVSKIRQIFQGKSKRITFINKNFFDVNISDATVIFVYLVPKALLKLKFKFAQELKPGTRIVSYRYQIPYLTLVKKDKLHKLFYYKVTKSFTT